ncbi:MAG: hypothetical protein LAO78_06470 [Acidobacteriia bacterium]|nr:hypothetical protein [Terriglobia bacterium]
MMLTLRGPFGSSISLDFRARFGESVELQCFQFVVPPIEFRLVRGSRPLQDWQQSNTEIYDLQHGPGVKEWARDGHSFVNDIDHRHDVMTCGLLSRDLLMETRGLGLDFVLLVWLRESTRRNL